MAPSRKYRDVMNRRGVSMMVDATPVMRRVRLLHRRGMPITRIAAESGVSVPTVHAYLRGYWCVKGSTVDVVRVQLSTAQAIMSVRYIEPNTDPRGREGARVDVTGTQRRLQALMAVGYPMAWQGLQLGPRAWFVTDIMNGTYVLSSTAKRVANMYDKYSLASPADAGIRACIISGAKNRARQRGYAPVGCWDEDTIDDPAAFPEWTGRCGTVFGWHIHKSERIPVCQPCADARGSGDDAFSGPLFQSYRQKRGYSRPQLARKVGVHPSTIQYWESGRSVPSPEGMLSVALLVLDVTYEQVCEQGE
jgi:DNA-binding XRE family transcriptional regulator